MGKQGVGWEGGAGLERLNLSQGGLPTSPPGASGDLEKREEKEVH